MAKAIRNSGVTLCMSKEEASTLLTITRFIGGDPETSRRKHSQAIQDALEAICVEYDVSDVDRDISEIIFITKPVKHSFNVGDVVEIVNSEGAKAEYLQCGNVGEVVGFDNGYVQIGIYKSENPAQEWYFYPSSLKLLRKAKG